MNEEFEKIYEVMCGRIHAVVDKYGGLLKMDKEDLEQELMILLFQLIEKHGYEEMMNRGPYFYRACVNTVYNLSLKEHKQGLFLECSNIMIGDDEFDIWDTYIDDGIDYEMKDEYLERYYEKQKQLAREYYWNNRDKRLKWQKEYYETHKEERKNYEEANRAKIKEYKKQYYETHKEEFAERQRKYYEAHREEMKEYNKQYNEAHREEKKEYNKQYHETHREKRLEYKKQYNEAHREEIKEYQRKYRQKKKQQKLEEAA